MTERSGGNQPWWEFDPDDKPISLLGLGEPVESQQDIERLGDHVSAVELQRGATQGFREAATGGNHDFHPNRSCHRGGDRPERSRRVLHGSPKLLAAVVLLAGCVVMFALGWRHGISVREASDELGRNARSVAFEHQHSGVTGTTDGMASTRFTDGLTGDGVEHEEVGR